jgi:hypothetical protein
MENVVDNIILSFLDICKRTNINRVQFLEAIRSTNKQLQMNLKFYRTHSL